MTSMGTITCYTSSIPSGIVRLKVYFIFYEIWHKWMLPEVNDIISTAHLVTADNDLIYTSILYFDRGIYCT